MRRTLVPLTLLAVFIAGCGSSSNRAESYSGLMSKASAICTSLTPAVKAAGAANDYDKALKLTEDGVAKLKALKPPDKLKPSYEAFVSAADANLADIKQVVAALDAKDTAKAQSLTAAADASNKQVDDAAAAVGLTECANG